MKDLFKGKFEYIAGRMDEADLLVALKCNDTDITQYQSAFYELIHICKTKLFCQVSIGVGQVVSEIVGLRLSFEEAADALQFRALHDKIGLHYYQVVENESQSALIFPNDAAFELVKELSDYGRSQAEKKQRVHQSILAFYAHFSQQRVSIHRLREHSFRLYFILLENVGQSVLSPDQLTDIQDRYSRLLSQNVYIKDFVVSVGALADELDLRIREIGSKSNMRIIQICKDYIGEHFAEDISLASVAKIVHLTPNYLSRLFKDLTGENFSEYINRYRIKEAVSLLQNKPSMKIYEVGEAVGLGNYKYFAQVFKKYTGTSPTQFKK